MELPDVKAEQLAGCFPEMRPYAGRCRFSDCTHINEPGCAVREAMEEGRIARERYDSYSDIFNELHERRKY